MQIRKFICLLLLSGITSNVAADQPTKIAVFAFELYDYTSLPNTPAEIERTAKFKPYLEQALLRHGNTQIVQINAADYANQNAGPGYLYKFYDLAADLGKKAGADWVVVARHSKPSFLFSYIMAKLINVPSKTITARYDIELKGNHEKVSRRATKKAAQKIHISIKLATTP